jgi:aspartyl-tRNA(Asn)/glutamyl-tRNA(Gln) amidotransferase subunit A
MPGGSSSGSAVAVARGIAALGLGTDSGGSVRQPAAWCGLVGFKPTLGSVPLGGCAPMAPSLDTCGVLARSVRDCRAWLEAALGRPVPATRSGSVRIGVLASAFGGAPGVAHACRAALEAWGRAGASLQDLELAWERRILGPIYSTELAAAWGSAVDANPELFGADVRSGIDAGRAVPAGDYRAALELVEELRIESAARAETVDVIACPASPDLPPLLGDPDPVVRAGRNTRIFNGLGWPAITIPCGSVDGLPVGLQLAAPAGRDAALLGLAEQLETILSGAGAARA